MKRELMDYRVDYGREAMNSWEMLGAWEVMWWKREHTERVA